MSRDMDFGFCSADDERENDSSENDEDEETDEEISNSRSSRSNRGAKAESAKTTKSSGALKKGTRASTRRRASAPVTRLPKLSKSKASAGSKSTSSKAKKRFMRTSSSDVDDLELETFDKLEHEDGGASETDQEQGEKGKYLSVSPKVGNQDECLNEILDDEVFDLLEAPKAPKRKRTVAGRRSHASKSASAKSEFGRAARSENGSEGVSKKRKRSDADSTDDGLAKKSTDGSKRNTRRRSTTSKKQDSELVQSDVPESEIATRRNDEHTRDDLPSDEEEGSSEEQGAFACAYCSKTFAGRKGLEYHLKQYVCRPDERPGGSLPKGKRKKTDSMGLKVYARVRGSLEDRTCPKCERVFTSAIGLNYHLNKKVCVIAKLAQTPFPKLDPGTKLLSPYGVVEVLRDDRASPTAVYAHNYRVQAKQYYSAKTKRDNQIEKARMSSAVRHLKNRKRYNNIYKRGHIAKDTVFAVQFRKDPRYIPDSEHIAPMVLPKPNTPDPSEPEGSYPDRIVECILVKDERQSFLGIQGETSVDALPKVIVSSPGTRLFLRRRCLGPLYSVSAERHICPTCGQIFAARAGLTAHMKQEQCVKKSQERCLQRDERVKITDERAFKLWRRGEDWMKRTVGHRASVNQQGTSSIRDHVLKKPPGEVMTAQASTQPQKPPTAMDKVATQILPPAVPPESSREGMVASVANVKSVMQEAALDKGEPQDFTQMDIGEAPPTTLKASTASARKAPPASKKKPSTSGAGKKIEDPRETLADLEAQLRYQQSMMLGPMYPSVFKSLGYKKPSVPTKPKKQQQKKKVVKKIIKKVITKIVKKPRPRKRTSGNNEGQESAEKETKEDVTASDGLSRSETTYFAGSDLHSYSSLPPMINTRAIVNEINVGRYPSLKRNNNSTVHEKQCPICRGGKGTLIPCCFCTNAIHLPCLLKKYTIKAPEPEDDFLCHNCIQYVVTRRVRAEKRRLLKLGKDQTTDGEVNLEYQAKMIPETRNLVAGREYECVIAQGRQAADLVELLRDAERRLFLSAAQSKASSYRIAFLKGEKIEVDSEDEDEDEDDEDCQGSDAS